MSQSGKILSLVRQMAATLMSAVFALTTFLASESFAQRQQPPPPKPPEASGTDKGPSDEGSPMTTFEEELRAKRAIRLAEKQYEENIGRAKEITQVAHELQDAAKSKSFLNHDDVKRLDRIEKLARKIRGDAGGAEEEIKIEKPPSDVPSTVEQIGDTAESLSKNVQSTPRQVISAAVIDTANVLLELVKMARSFAH